MTGTSGPTSRPPFAFYDPDSRSLRTSNITFDLGLPPSSPTLPASGSMRNGSLFARRWSVLRTLDPVSSSSPLLPTPTTSEATGPQPNTGRTGGKSLRETLLPTPAARDGKGRDLPSRQGGPSLPSALLPTPAAGNFNDGESLESWTARRDQQKARGINGNGMGTPLSIAVRLLPTPTAAEGDRTSATFARGNPTLNGALLPTPMAADGGLNRGSSAGNGLRNVSRRISRGEPTSPPSDAGKASSAGQLLLPLSLEPEESPD
jgi:hypothetical protein